MGFFTRLGFELSDKGEQALFKCLDIGEPLYYALRDGDTVFTIPAEQMQQIRIVLDEAGLSSIFDGDFGTVLDRVIKLKKERGWK